MAILIGQQIPQVKIPSVTNQAFAHHSGTIPVPTSGKKPQQQKKRKNQHSNQFVENVAFRRSWVLTAVCITRNLATTSSFAWDEGWSLLPGAWSCQQHQAGVEMPRSKRANLFADLKVFKPPGKTLPWHLQLCCCRGPGVPKMTWWSHHPWRCSKSV